MADVNEIVSKEAIKGVERLETATKQTAKQVQALYDVSKKLDTELKGLSISTKSAKDTQQKLNDVQKKALKINNDVANVRKKVTQVQDGEKDSLIKLKSQLQQATNETKKAIEVERSKTAAWKKSQKVTEQSTVAINKNKRIIKLRAAANAHAKGSYDKLAAQLSLNIAKYKALSAAQQKSSKGQNLIKNIQNQDKALKKLDATMGRSQRNVGNYGEGFTKAFAKIGIAVVGAMAAFRGLSRVFGGIIGIATEFDKSMKDVAAITLGTTEEVARLEMQAKKLGATTIFTASEVVGLEKELAKLGFSTDAIIAGSGGILALASAMDEDLAQSAKVSGATIRQFGLDTSEMGRVVDVMTLGFARSALDLGHFENAMSKAGPIARQYGFSLEETTGFLGELMNAGFEASMAGTAFRNIMLNLADSGGALAQRLGGAVGSSDELLTALSQLKNEGVDLNEILELTDRRSAGAFGVFMEGTETTRELIGALNDAGGTAQRMADIQLESVQSRMKLLNSAWQGWILSMDSGNGVISKTIKGFADLGAKVLTALTSNDKLIKTITDIIKILGMATGAWLLYKGAMFAWAKGTIFVNAITKTAKAVQVAYSVAVGKSTGIVKKAIAIQKALKVAMIATPWGAIAAAIGLIVGALIVFTKRASAAEKAQKTLNDINVKAQKTVAGQRVEMDLLLATARDTEASYAMRNDAIKKLNEISPEYLGNLTLENINSKDAATSIDAYTESILRNAQAIAERESLVDIEKKLIEVRREQADTELSTWQVVTGARARAGDVAKKLKEKEEGLLAQKKAISNQIREGNKAQSESIKLDETSIIEGEKATTGEIVNLEKIAAAKKRLESVGQKIDISETKRAGTERLIELQTQLQNQQITQKEFDDLKAESAYDTNVKILEQEAAFIVKALENKDLEASERLSLEDQLAGKLLDSQKLFSDEALRIAKENKDEVLQAELLANQAAIDAAQQKVATINATANANLLFQKKRYAEGIISAQEYSDIVAQIELNKNLDIIAGEMDVLDVQRKNIQKQLDNSNLLPEEKRKINTELEEIDKNYNEMSMEMDDLRTDHAIENMDKEREAFEKLKQLKFDTEMQFANATFEFATMFGEKQMMRLEEEKEAALAMAGDSASEKARIEEEFAAKVAKVKRRQALIDKAQAIFNIGINTWVGVTKTIATMGAIPAAPFIPWIIAQGVIAAALVAAKPVPKFAKGIKSSPAGPAEVGEKGRELGITPSGKAFISESGQVVNLEKGTRIFNNKETEEILNMDKSGALGYDMSELMDSPTGYGALTTFNEMYAKLDSNGIITAIGEGNDKLINVIKRKKEFHFNSSKGSITERDGGYYKNYLNMKIKA